ncbi:MAG: formylglycine-generating enzyme family protein [Planctomycetaceae bacterium]|nr:formylglycine-generating enzyme family protein [Planctomycetaceae bacterium]
MVVLGPSTFDHPLADGIPPSWASAWGEDEYGPWVEIHADDAKQSLRWIPPGNFLMGSPDQEEGRRRDEGPQQPVTISRGFWLFDTPCTQGFWEAVMEENPSHFKGKQRPVERVSWDDCQKFIRTLNASVPDLHLRLPTEAEWEYACRGMTQTSTYLGDLSIDKDGRAKRLEQIAWYEANSGGETHPVGELQPNGFGLFDMLGNVWEWCRDNGYRKYTSTRIYDPGYEKVDSPADRVFRGGSWGHSARLVRAAYRDGHRPESSGSALGFRCSSSGL